MGVINFNCAAAAASPAREPHPFSKNFENEGAILTTIAVTAANQLLLPRSLFFKEVQKQRINRIKV